MHQDVHCALLLNKGQDLGTTQEARAQETTTGRLWDWQLKIRTNRQDPKYLATAGGHPCLFGADTLVPGEPAILAEGEFDALLLWQVGDLVGVATLGSCKLMLPW